MAPNEYYQYIMTGKMPYKKSRFRLFFESTPSFFVLDKGYTLSLISLYIYLNKNFEFGYLFTN